MIHLSLEPETEVLYIYTQSHTCILNTCSIDMYSELYSGMPLIWTPLMWTDESLLFIEVSLIQGVFL